jgi:hypothetical protein
MTPERKKLLEETTASVRRLQEFDPKSIIREDDLGKALNFRDAVPDATRLVNLFREVSLSVLPDLSGQYLTQLKQNADARYQIFSQILAFNPEAGGTPDQRRNLTNDLRNSYDGVFDAIWPSIAYSTRRSTDFGRLETEARAAVQAITDRTTELEEGLQKTKADAESALEAIRKVAAEQGVSQQAVFFKEEADAHEVSAATWLTRTRNAAVALGTFAVLTLFLHKIPGLKPDTPAEAIQFGIGKALVFATLGYALLLCARNFMAHRHNAIVNKHRRNSLATFEALVVAAGDEANRDIILTKAAETIFGPQATGFTVHDSDESKALSMVNVGASMLKPPSGH